jgi:tRNA nucleotidyltransferase (CCA-adding enzyme)
MTTLHEWVQGLGLDAYEVGGAVRDSLMGRKPKDVDYMLMASPQAIRESVERCGGVAQDLVVRDRIVGVRAHVAGVTPPDGVELAPPRVERSTGPGRHDFVIAPHPSVMGPASMGLPIVQDAQRRDFTVNALYRNLATGDIVDPLGGRADLEARQLRTTAPQSFRDDPLRILRGLRLMSTHGFTLHQGTRVEMMQHAGCVTALTHGGVSGTARAELDKLLMGTHVGPALRMMRDTGVLGSFLPELATVIGFDQRSRYHDLTLDEHTIAVVENAASANASLAVRLAALFHDAGKPEVAWTDADGRAHYYDDGAHEDHAVVGARIARAALTRLAYPSAVVGHVERLVRHHMVTVASTKKAAKVRRWRAAVGPNLVDDLLTLRYADVTAKGEANPEHVAQLEQLRDRLVAEAASPAVVGDLVIDGRDLMALGVPSGPAIGWILRGLLADVVASPELNKRDWLFARARTRLNTVVDMTVLNVIP